MPSVVALFTTLLIVADAIPLAQHQYKRSLTNDAASIADRRFDYVIAGGGLGGLTVASLLSEDPEVSVLVIEQGYDQSSNPMVYDVRAYGEAFNHPELDFAFQSTPISWRNDETLSLVAGKMLGGSGSLNGASWTKGPRSQYDMLPMLTGDDSWSFENFNKWMLKAEKFSSPNATEVAKGARFIDECHGRNGLVDVSFASGMFGTVQLDAINASQSLWPGMKVNADAASGIVNGVTTVPNMLHPTIEQNRSSPYTAYVLDGAPHRDNLHILLGHRVTSIIWDDTSAENLVATGVTFQHSSTSELLTVYADREVLLAAGSMQSPQLLELSGIGDPAILEPLGIPVVKAIPQIGRNFQEQTKNTVTFKPRSTMFNGTGPPSAIAFPNAQQVLGHGLAEQSFEESLAGLSKWAKHLEDAGFIMNATSYLPILEAQLRNIQTEAAVEIFFTVTPATGTVGIDLWNLIILSRGSIHIQSTDPWKQPLVNPAYFDHPLDLLLQTHATKQSREVYGISPLSDLIDCELEPGLAEVPADASYEEWEYYVKQTFTSVWHPIATLAMMKEEFGGVVDSKLKVYGVQNVRAIDASVLPVQLSAHLSSSLYGIAEKVAADIKEEWKGK